MQTWGNSLALRIPKAVSEDLGFKKNSTVELKVDGGLLVVVPRSGRRARLQKLLAQITPENLHDKKEWFGQPVGREVW